MHKNIIYKMKYIKKFENNKILLKKNQEKFEEKLNQIAIYLEDKLGMSEDEGFVECLWSEYNYEDKGVVYFEFDFISIMTWDLDDFDEKMDKFLSQYDKNYKQEYKNYNSNNRTEGHDIYTIKLNDSDIKKLYKEFEIYNDAKKYNL